MIGCRDQGGRQLISYVTVDPTVHERPWLTLVHGFSHNRSYFDLAVPHLREHFRLLLVDLRGHGDSADLPGPYGIEEYADDVAEVLHHQGIDRTGYWGTHTGAGVGLALATRRPALLASMVLEGVVLPGAPMPRTTQLLATAAATAGSEGVARARDEWFEQADWFAYMREHPADTNAEGHRHLLAAFSGRPWLSRATARPVTVVEPHLARMDQAALLYNGVFDLPEFLRTARTVEAGLPNATRVELAGTGGFPLWERPDAVIPLVTGFLTTA
jgi:pimeloyl-ACP methyl ester carboxylesterase